MSVTTTNIRNDFTGTADPATHYNFSFKATAESWVKVTLAGVLQSSGYAVVLNADQDASPGGYVTFTVAPGAVAVGVYRQTPLTQETSLSAYSPFPAKTMESSLDKATMAIQDAALGTGAFAAAAASSAAAAAATLAAAAAGSTGSSSSLVLATGSTVPRTLADRAGDVVNVKDFGAVGDGVTDDTAAIQAAIDEGISSGSEVWVGGGTYRLTGSLVVAGKVKVSGRGNQLSVLSLATSVAGTPAISVSIGDNSSIIGLDIGGLGITANAGSAVGSGIEFLTTATNSAISQSCLHDLFIRNVATGIRLDGVIYMVDFARITVTGTVTGYGWYADSTKEIIYNTFRNLEVTGVSATAYAYWIHSAASMFANLTADGCCYFANPYGTIDGLSIEGISAASTPSTYAVQINQAQSLRNTALINIPNSKCQYGIDVLGQNVLIDTMRTPDSGAGNQPNRLINLHAAGTGIITNVKSDRAVVDKLEAYLSDSILNGYVITASADITVRGSSYEEGAWTPVFGAGRGWTTDPTLINASYTKVGRQITVTAYLTNGVCTAGASIGGLPVAARSTVGSAAGGSCSDSTKRIAGSVTPSGTSISNLPANVLTSQYWQITATYFQ